MFSTKQRTKAIETFIEYDHSYADTIAELGYPTRSTLRIWWKEYAATGEVPAGVYEREPRYSTSRGAWRSTTTLPTARDSRAP